MENYEAPLQDMNFVLHELAGLDRLQKLDVFAEVTDDVVGALQRLKEMEQENARLKRMYADLALSNTMLKDVLEKKF